MRDKVGADDAFRSNSAMSMPKKRSESSAETLASSDMVDIYAKAIVPPRKATAHHAVRNHSSEHWKDLARINVTIIPKVWDKVLVATLWALLVTTFSLVSPVHFLSGLPNSLIFVNLASVVCSLLLGFRLNTAYDRFQEGRRLWSTIFCQTLNIARTVATTRSSAPNVNPENEKALMLLIGFATAVKHRLRFERELHYSDLEPFVSHVMSATNTPQCWKRHLPSDILNHFQAHIARTDQMSAPVLASLSSLVEAVAQLERIVDTRIPPGYTITLDQCLVLYLAALPFELVPSNGWWTVAISLIVSFVILGLLEISQKIEDPFGYFIHDLELDEYCSEIRFSLDFLLVREEAFGTRGFEWGKPSSMLKSLQGAT
ncbi:Bestrophin, RFP-TM, chloride channel-domain-containing protein [Chytriomyces sp. MP71]|nr:Bestrophin, RFP-TM, chloride channel-domain-containing protein [Chytriomyces sp. MP71]